MGAAGDNDQRLFGNANSLQQVMDDPDIDVREFPPDVLRHRLVLSYEALADDVTADSIVDGIIASVPMPDVPLQEARRI